MYTEGLKNTGNLVIEFKEFKQLLLFEITPKTLPTQLFLVKDIVLINYGHPSR